MENILYEIIKQNFKVEKIEIIKNKVYFDSYYATLTKCKTYYHLKIICDEWQVSRTYPIMSQDILKYKIYITILNMVYNNNINYVINNKVDEKIALF